VWYPLSTKPPANITLLVTNIKEPGYFAFMNTGTFPWDPLARWPLAVWGKGFPANEHKALRDMSHWMLIEDIPTPEPRSHHLKNSESSGDWITDPMLYRAVAFVRKMVSKGESPEEALTKAQEYFKLSRASILEHAGNLNDPLQYHALKK
jgi:hypothetical protein